MTRIILISGFILSLVIILKADRVYVDPGIPYNDGPLKIADNVITISIDQSPKHVKVYFPEEVGTYAVIYFIGGLGGYAPVEFYSIFMSKLASHGFFVFGIDYAFPLDNGEVGEDLEKYFAELNFLQRYMLNRTVATPDWNNTGLLCHSAGCEYTYQMIQAKRNPFMSSAFLEPYSATIHHTESALITIPALMYTTELALKLPHACNIRGYGFEKFYNAWRCPRIELEIAEFGHCDILDPLAWDGCHVGKFCETTDNKRLDIYRQTVTGIAASFFVATLQGRSDVLDYVIDEDKIPLKMLIAKSDWNCTSVDNEIKNE